MAFHPHHLSISENVSACLMQHQYASENKKWQAYYDIAVWLRCMPQLSGHLSLELSFKDDSGQHKVLVERCDENEKRNHFLAGHCQLTVVGKISHAELTITTSELHMFSFIETSITPSSDLPLSL